MSYAQFLESKRQLGGRHGFEPLWMPEFLFDFQQSLVEWATRKGRAALFCDCGMGKTPMQLVWAQNVVMRTNRPVLIVAPLAASTQTVREAAKFGIACERSSTGQHSDDARIIVTNYERLHLFDASRYAGMVCDESSILKNFDGVTKAAVTEFMRLLPYRLLCTATAAPNDYIELGTSSEALGEMGHVDMLGRFFKNDESSLAPMSSGTKWRFKPHAERPFWQWMSGWARAARKPSDVGPFSDARMTLPALHERIVTVEASRPMPGHLFVTAARTLPEQRLERRSTLKERCEAVAAVVAEHDSSLIWCHLNDEGDLLERLIPGAVQVAGKDSDEYKVMAAEWFAGDKCLCNEKLFSAKLAAWRNDQRATGRSGIESTAKNASPKPLNTPSGIEPSERRISPLTTSATNLNTNSQQSAKSRKTKSAKVAMGATLFTENFKKSPPESGGPLIQSSDLIRECASMGSPLKATTGSSLSRAELVASAEADQETDAGIVSMLTTATAPDTSGGCSALDATLELENSETTLTGSKEPLCICGHKSGRRRLISKPRVLGLGLNFQSCAHVTFFPSHSYEQYYQAVRRCWRYGQTRDVTVHVITTQGEADVLGNLQRKAAAADKMFAFMAEEMRNATHESD